jgi:hypothetical protein
MPIQINLTRDDKTTNDDVITIRKNVETGDFELIYRDPNEGSPVKHQITGMYQQRVIDYTYVLLKNQYLDEQKFKDVQFTIPGMPRVIVSAEKFASSYYREHFQEMIEFGLDNLENTSDITKKTHRTNSYATPPPVVRRRRYSFEEPEEGEDADEFTRRQELWREVTRSPMRDARPQHLFFDE